MNDAKNQIGFEQLGLGSVLKQNQLQVPANQREYAWTDREVTQLFQDYARAITEGEYFLGTLVTIPRVSGTLEVVDGQQRLATTAILLAAIRDYLLTRNEAVLVESINNEFLTGINRDQRIRTSRLALNLDDNELFNWIVARAPNDPRPEIRHSSHERLVDAYSQAKKQVANIISSYDPKDHGDILNNWVSFIEDQAMVVLLKVPNGADAYKMFETLNDRGLRTSQADLIKNYLFGRSGQRLGETQSHWSYMRGALESLEDDDITVNFLRHALIAIRGYLREAEVYDVVQGLVKSEQSAVSFSSTLETLANSYIATFNPEHERWNSYPESVRRAIEVLNLLNIRPLRPLMLSIATKMGQKDASDGLRFAVALGVRLLIASTTRSGSVETPLAAAANHVFDGTIKTVGDLKASLSGITPSDQAFEEAFAQIKISGARLARYYLRSLELTAQSDPEPWFVPINDHDVINLEHILPRKPLSNWPKFSQEEVDQFSSRLGNQCLLRASDNSALNSDSFADKKPILAASPYNLTSRIATYSDWDIEAIKHRQAELAKLAPATWPI